MEQSKYRIDQIEQVRINRVNKLRFRAYEYRNGAYMHIGTFNAPANTAKKDLHLHIPQSDE